MVIIDHPPLLCRMIAPNKSNRFATFDFFDYIIMPCIIANYDKDRQDVPVEVEEGGEVSVCGLEHHRKPGRTGPGTRRSLKSFGLDLCNSVKLIFCHQIHTIIQLQHYNNYVLLGTLLTDSLICRICVTAVCPEGALQHLEQMD